MHSDFIQVTKEYASTNSNKMKEVESLSKTNSDSTKSNTTIKCSKCRQFFRDITVFGGDPDDAREEFVALTDESLSLFGATW